MGRESLPGRISGEIYKLGLPAWEKLVIIRLVSAGMAELADALDLGSSVPDVQVQVLLPAWNLRAKNVEKSMFLALFSLLEIEKVAKR